jgi:nucleoside 2-deoxyribosyltransferase
VKVVYIAGPFRPKRENDCWEMENNIRRAEALALEVWKLGAAAICPHSNTRFFQNALPDEVWLEGDLAMLAKCDAILMTPDWERSAGARAERAFAYAHGILVFEKLELLALWLETQKEAAA